MILATVARMVCTVNNCSVACWPPPTAPDHKSVAPFQGVPYSDTTLLISSGTVYTPNNRLN